MMSKFFDGFVPIQGEFRGDRPRVRAPGRRSPRELQVPAMDRMDFQGAFAEVLRLVGRANKYIDETAPWSLAKDGSGKGPAGHRALQRSRDLQGCCDTVLTCAHQGGA
ncbi:MAG: hypothetical protein MZU97_27025 [Bacillus subtilis]|nr:hypothetical protein [Bacillus subtilis]